MSIVRIAEAAQVSYSTAWRVINNHPVESEEAANAVRAAMGRLGYDRTRPSRRGRKPRVPDGIRTRNIALLHLRQSTSFSASILGCVGRMLAERNLNLIYAHCASADELPHAVRSGNIDGILGYGQPPAQGVDGTVRKIPSVWMMSRSDLAPDPWGDRVQPDHHAIGQMAADYLLERGHRRLAYLNPDTTLPIYRHRLTAFRSAAEAAGVSTHVYASKGIEDLNLEAQHLVAQWMASSDRPTALFVPVDRVTLFIYRHLERRGVTPGKDVDIISCDNEKQLLSLMNPPPASIDLNREMIARLAVERLLWRMRNGVSSPSVVTAVSPTLMARETLEGKELEVAPA